LDTKGERKKSVTVAERPAETLDVACSSPGLIFAASGFLGVDIKIGSISSVGIISIIIGGVFFLCGVFSSAII